jgi:DNA repair protein RecN (Recombination protein N)
MLVELQIRDFAIIDRLSLRLGPGLNALTGETGAGKSIIIDALGAVLGDRTAADVVRTGAKRASVDATFELDRLSNRVEIESTLDELGIEPEEGTLILSREISASGRSGARINGRAVTAAILQRVGHLLVDIHGQSEHLSLLRSDQQLMMLDRYAGTLGQRAEFAGLVGRIRDLREQIAGIERGERDRAQRIDLLSFQANEIASAALSPGEDASLASERRVLESTERLVTESAEAIALLLGADVEGEQPAIASVRRVHQLAIDLAQIDPALSDVATRLGEQLYLLEDIAAEFRDYRDAIDPDPNRLEIVEDRLDLIQGLKRKYGSTVEEIIAFGENAQRELESLTGGAGGIEALRTRLDALETKAAGLAKKLSARRTVAAERMSSEIEQAIHDLRMGRASVVVQVSQHETPDGLPLRDGTRVSFDATGIDKVEFMLAANLGEVLRPLARVASGGETARLMLAIKSILATADATPTLVFDEVDTGVGGRSGQVVGEKLWSLTDDHQVIVITHLAQIAAFGDAHFRIAKHDRDGVTLTDVQEITGDVRIAEVAEMLAGEPPTPATIKSATEMLDVASEWKREARRVATA